MLVCASARGGLSFTAGSLMTADVVAAVVEDVAPPAPPWTIDDQLLRDLAVKINPHVALGSTHAANLAPTGWLADVVTKHGWDEALDKYPGGAGVPAPVEEHVGRARRGGRGGVEAVRRQSDASTSVS